MGLLASGALLIVVNPGCEGKVRDALKTAGIPCAGIGRTCAAEKGLRWTRRGSETDLPEFVSDELVKAFAGVP
jgi:hydrogenase maturation factor